MGNTLICHKNLGILQYIYITLIIRRRRKCDMHWLMTFLCVDEYIQYTQGLGSMHRPGFVGVYLSRARCRCWSIFRDETYHLIDFAQMKITVWTALPTSNQVRDCATVCFESKQVAIPFYYFHMNKKDKDNNSVFTYLFNERIWFAFENFSCERRYNIL